MINSTRRKSKMFALFYLSLTIQIMKLSMVFVELIIAKKAGCGWSFAIRVTWSIRRWMDGSILVTWRLEYLRGRSKPRLEFDPLPFLCCRCFDGVAKAQHNADMEFLSQVSTQKWAEMFFVTRFACAVRKTLWNGPVIFRTNLYFRVFFSTRFN